MSFDRLPKLIRFRGGWFFCIAICVLIQQMVWLDEASIVSRTREGVVDFTIPKTAAAVGKYYATGGVLNIGTEVAGSASNIPSWRATLGNDSTSNGGGNYWTTARTASGLSKLLYFDGVQEQGANKMIVTLEDTNITTGDVYEHLICDWVSSTDVYIAADSDCTGGGWRSLHPLRSTYTSVADTTRTYELYDGYFWTTADVAVPTPISNFIEAGSGRVLVRAYSTVNSAVEHRTDIAYIEMAIDPVYEPSGYATTSIGAVTNGVRHLIGSGSTGVTASDGARMTLPMPAVDQPVDAYFSFTNIRTYEGMNTVLISPEICVSNVALTFAFYAYNFTEATWNKGTATTTGTVCNTDSDYGFTINSETIPGFAIEDYINAGELRIRVLTNAPSSVYSIRFDRLYLMLGSVNADSSLCEISWGSGTATDCTKTRFIGEALTATPASTTWQITSALEYTSSLQHPGDNDDDTTDGEHAFAGNITVPVAPPVDTTVTAVHYALKFRSNISSMTVDPQFRNYSSMTGVGGNSVGSGWMTSSAVDNNAATTYGYYDTWRIVELQNDAAKYVHFGQGQMNVRLRTSQSTNTATPTTMDWSFLMTSIRFLDTTRHTSITSTHDPDGGVLNIGDEVAGSASNIPSWRATLGNDSTSNGAGNYWTTTRTASGLSKLLYFDGVTLLGANKLIIKIEDSNITTGNTYEHLICDWTSSTDVYLAADSDCTGGGWRSLNPLRATYTSTTDTLRTYEIYDGYFWTTSDIAVPTPLVNFISSSSKRVLIRTYSTENSAVGHRTDSAQVEVAIDPVYEPSGYATTSVGTVTNGVRHLIGAIGTNVTASDNAKMILPMPAVSQPVDVYFKFQNIKSYTGANTIFLTPEVCASNVALTFAFYAYNFADAEWNKMTATTTGTACNTDTAYGFSLNDTSYPGFTLTDYISAGEFRIRFLTNAPGTVYNAQIDRFYLMLGSVNTDSSLCEISWGSGTATDCTKTRYIADGLTDIPASTTWQVTSATEYQGTQHSDDNDDDANDGEYAKSANISFPVSISSSTAVTGIHYALKFRSNEAAVTWDPQIKKYSGLSGLSNNSIGSGWVDTPGTDANALTTYSYFDTWQIAELQNAVDDSIDFENNLMNIRLRTSISTNTTTPVDADWAFALASIRYVETTDTQRLTFSLSDNAVGFGDLSALTARYATGDGAGSTTATYAHELTIQTNAPGGYAVALSGTTLECCNGGASIDAIGGTATTSSPGTAQFGLSLESVAGAGSVLAPYNGSTTLFAFATSSFPDALADGPGTGLYDIYHARYVGNITPNTAAGSYNAIITYTVTGTY